VRWLTTAHGFEAQLIRDRLAEAGIAVALQGVGGWERSAAAGPHDIYVEDADLERAREALREARGEDAPLQRSASLAETSSVDGAPARASLGARLRAGMRRRRHDPFGRPTDHS
jgi:peptidoglycan/xylan/chitin deacetylase (PgdA/CDA1 family)